MSRHRTDGDRFDSLEDFEDIGISVMEELDPEPQPKSGSLYARDFIIGIVLVLGVLAFAGWQWWQTEYRQSNYRLGEQAARQYDWDEARARFSAAEGYRDADKRAEAAADRVQERDEHYSLALEHFNSGRWAAALKELRTVREVQPGYRDLASMEAQTEEKVYKEALLGAVVMRPKADPPGLYYRAESGWIWLDGSDEHSMPWGHGTPGHVVYDAPIEGWVLPTPSSRPSPGNRPDLRGQERAVAGRRLMVASFDISGSDMGVSFSELPFSPSDISWFEWNREGVWAIRYTDEDNYPVPDPTPVRQKILNIQQLTYHAFGTRIMRSTNPVFYGMNLGLMNYDRNGNGLLVANWTRHEDGTFTVDLYLNTLADGGNRLLYSHKGGFVHAYFSDDSRYVFLTTYKSVGSMLEDHALLMIDTTGAEPVRVLLEQKGAKAINGEIIEGYQFMQAQLLQAGPFAGKVLLTHWRSYTNYISVLDLHAEQAVQAEVSITGNGSVWWNVFSSEGPDLVLSGVGLPHPQGRQTLVAVRISPDGTAVFGRQPLSSLTSVGALQQRGPELIYLLYNHSRNGEHGTVELHSLPMSELKGGDGPARSLKRLEFPWAMEERRMPFGDFRFNFGSGMFAYLDQTTLRAVTYDGQVSLPLESDVTELFNRYLANP